MDALYFTMGVVGFAALCVIGVALVLTPWLIAKARDHRAATGILICSLIGAVLWPVWIVALVWSFTGEDHAAARSAVIRRAANSTMFDPAPSSVRALDAEIESRA